MNIAKAIQATTKVIGVLVAAFVALIIGYVAFAYVSYLDETTTAGSAHGYTIGQSRSDAYHVTQSKFLAGDIGRIHTIESRDEEMRRHPELGGDDTFHSVAEVRDWFENWNHWSLWIHADDREPLVIIKFHGDAVSNIDSSENSNSKSWQPPNAPTFVFSVGQTYNDVYRSLEGLVSVPGYESLQLHTGWMARRQPVRFDDSEFRFVRDDDTWLVLVGHGDSFFNNVELRFENDRLMSIRRHRQYFEML